jgi:hypothetical protein
VVQKASNPKTDDQTFADFSSETKKDIFSKCCFIHFEAQRLNLLEGLVILFGTHGWEI